MKRWLWLLPILAFLVVFFISYFFIGNWIPGCAIIIVLTVPKTVEYYLSLKRDEEFRKTRLVTEDVVIEELKLLFDKKGKWNKGSFGVAEDGTKLTLGEVNDKRCKSYCLTGGIEKIVKSFHIDGRIDFLRRDELFKKVHDRLTKKVLENGYPGIVNFNDDPKTTFKDIRKFLKSL